jgi:hypothetical protein
VTLYGYQWRRAFQQLPAPTFGNPSKGAILGVASALETFADSNGANARPGARRLAAESGFNFKTVGAALRWLTDHGWLVCTEQGTGRSAPCYRFAIPDDPRSTERSATVPDLWTDPGESRSTERQDLRATDNGSRSSGFPVARRSVEITDVETDNADADSSSVWGGHEGDRPDLATDDEVALRYWRMGEEVRRNAPDAIDHVRAIRDEHRLPSRLDQRRPPEPPAAPRLRAVPAPAEEDEIDPLDAIAALQRERAERSNGRG